MSFLKLRCVLITLICSFGWLICGLINWWSSEEDNENDSFLPLAIFHNEPSVKKRYFALLHMLRVATCVAYLKWSWFARLLPYLTILNIVGVLSIDFDMGDGTEIFALYYIVVTFLTTYCDFISNISVMTVALIGQQVIARHLGQVTAINVGGVAAILVINILVSSMLHLTVMYHGELTTQERCKAMAQSDILDSQEEGVVILDPGKNEILYCNRAAQRHLTSRSPLSAE